MVQEGKKYDHILRPKYWESTDTLNFTVITEYNLFSVKTNLPNDWPYCGEEDCRIYVKGNPLVWGHGCLSINKEFEHINK